MDRLSPLTALPPELRNRIWRYAIVQIEPIDVTGTTKKKEPALLAVCKQIRDEALRMLYHENAFFCLFKIEGNATANGTEGSASEGLDPKKLEINFCWIRALSVTVASFITDFRVQVEVSMTRGAVIPTQFGITSARVCDIIREQFSKKTDPRFMADWVPMLRSLGLKPHMVKFVVPDSIKTFDDATNKVIGEQWAKRLEESGLEQSPATYGDGEEPVADDAKGKLQ